MQAVSCGTCAFFNVLSRGSIDAAGQKQTLVVAKAASTKVDPAMNNSFGSPLKEDRV